MQTNILNYISYKLTATFATLICDTNFEKLKKMLPIFSLDYNKFM